MKSCDAKLLLLPWLLFSTIALATPQVPDPEAPGLSSTQRLHTLIERVQLEQRRIQTLEADFVQKKSSVWLVEPEEARGVFSFSAPHNVRWEYRSPDPTVVMIDDREMTTWFRHLGEAERLKIHKHSAQLYQHLGAGSSLEMLMEYFTVSVRFPESSGEPYRIELEPRYARIARRVKSMVLWIDSETFIAERLKYEGPNGDLTEYRFERVTINPQLPSDRFQLLLPPSVELREMGKGHGG